MGTAVTPVMAMKAFTLIMIMAFSTWIAAYTLGETADELIGWFDQYADDTKKEGTDKDDGEADKDGTAIYYDLLYHSITAGYSYIVLSVIMVGGGWFFNEFNAFSVTLGDDCKLDNVSTSTYSSIKNLI